MNVKLGNVESRSIWFKTLVQQTDVRGTWHPAGMILKLPLRGIAASAIKPVNNRLACQNVALGCLSCKRMPNSPITGQFAPEPVACGFNDQNIWTICRGRGLQ